MMRVAGAYSVLEPVYEPIEFEFEVMDAKLSLKNGDFHVLVKESETFAEMVNEKRNWINVFYYEFKWFLNALLHPTSTDSLDERARYKIARVMRCQKLIDQAKDDILNIISGFGLKEVNKAVHYYLCLKDDKILSVAGDAFDVYFGKVFLDARGKEELDTLIEVFNECGIDKVVLEDVSQEHIQGLSRWHSLVFLTIRKNQIHNLSFLPRNLKYLNLQGQYLSNTVDHKLPQLQTLIVDLGVFINDHFVQSLPKSIIHLSLFSSDITHAGLQSLSINITSIIFHAIEAFNDNTMKLMPKNLVQLTVISTGLTLTKEGFKAVPRKVESLTLHGKMPEIRAEGLSYLPSCLEHLSLEGCSKLDSNELIAISQVRQLSLLDNPPIRNPITFLKQLEYLKVWRCITFKGIRMFPDSLLSLDLSEVSMNKSDLDLLPGGLNTLILRGCWLEGQYIKYEIWDRKMIDEKIAQTSSA